MPSLRLWHPRSSPRPSDLARGLAPRPDLAVRSPIHSQTWKANGAGPASEGTVVVIGAQDKVWDRVILNRFVTLAGGPNARIVVISTASSLGLEAGERYRWVLAELGAATLRPLHGVTRPQANDQAAVRAIADATGIFVTDGNQLRLASTLGGTRLADAILERFRPGAVVARSSAGASAMSSHMRRISTTRTVRAGVRPGQGHRRPDRLARWSRCTHPGPP